MNDDYRKIVFGRDIQFSWDCFTMDLIRIVYLMRMAT